LELINSIFARSILVLSNFKSTTIKNRIVIFLIILSLGGLAFVQYRLLITGLALQKTNLDKKVENAMREIKGKLNTEDFIATDIANLISTAPLIKQEEKDSIKTSLTYKFVKIIQESIDKRGLTSANFNFAVTPPGQSLGVYFGSPDFDITHSKFSQYSHYLTGNVSKKCNCQLLLRLQIKNTFEYLLKQLQILIFSSILFLLLLAACCIWLLSSINKQRKLAEIKNDFINNLTHELKTPVFSVSLASKMLEQYLNDLSTEKPKEYLKLIQIENEKMQGHIDAVLELASLDSGKYIMDKEEIEMEAFLKKIVETYKKELEGENTELETNFDTKNTITLIDKTHFKNVIKNILENAKKYNDKEKLHIKITTQSIDNFYIIKIRDNGKGISKENQKHIFEKFYRVREGDLHEVKGFGLGLSYVQQVIKRHDGIISVESVLHEGSTFTIKIPIK
jgi:two-component system phosphate regulon sensor histidine kinase PhoR